MVFHRILLLQYLAPFPQCAADFYNLFATCLPT